MPDTLPETFGRYRIVKKLGEGGMGAVYLADDTRMRRKVALKVPKFRDNEDPRTIERFYREARLAGQITHPSLCPVHDVDCQDGIHYLTMAFIEGTPLDHFIGSDRPWPAMQAVKLVRQLASVLALLHAQGIIHRDLKPANVMMRPDGMPVLMDFGLARSFAADSQHLTTQGKPMGTPVYMAPEQINGDEKLIGPHTDVWALGVVLYQLLTGQLPFGGQTPMEVWSRILFKEVSLPSTLIVGLDPRLDAIFTQVLAKDPQQRPATMVVFDQLLTALDVQPPAVPPSRVSVPNDLPTNPTYGLPTLTPPRSTVAQGVRTLPMILVGAATLAGVIAFVLLLLVWLGAFTPTQQAQQTTKSTPTTTTGTTSTTPSKQASLRLVQPEEIALTSGDQCDITVRIEREGWDGEVALVPLDTPNDLQVTATPIPRGETTGTVKIRALKDATAGQHNIRLRALGDNLRSEQTLSVVVRSAPPPPVASLKLILPTEVSIRAGESQTMVVEIERKNFDGEVKLLRDGEPDGIQLRLSPIEEAKSKVNVQIQVNEAAKEGKQKVSLRALVPGKIDAEGSFTVVVKPAYLVLAKNFTNSIGMEFVFIPNGTFKMGSSKDDREKVEQHYKDLGLKLEDYKKYLDWEQPQHEVEITKPFDLGVYEVTQEEYEKVMDTNPAEFREGGFYEKRVKEMNTKRFPVENVSWDGAVKFCKALSDLPEEKKNKRMYRLPTEAEWEYACRGGSTSLFHYGDKLTHAEANFNSDYPFSSDDKKTYLGRPVPVDDPKYKPNDFGLYHMHGNVWEWCQDCFDEKHYQSCLDDPKLRQDPQGAQTPQNRRVWRGGSWFGDGRDCRSANRDWVVPGNRLNVGGFRVVCVRTR